MLNGQGTTPMIRVNRRINRVLGTTTPPATLSTLTTNRMRGELHRAADSTPQRHESAPLGGVFRRALYGARQRWLAVAGSAAIAICWFRSELNRIGEEWMADWRSLRTDGLRSLIVANCDKHSVDCPCEMCSSPSPVSQIPPPWCGDCRAGSVLECECAIGH